MTHLDTTSTTKALLYPKGNFLRIKPILTHFSHLHGKLGLQRAHTPQEWAYQPAKFGLDSNSSSSCPFRPVPISVKHHPVLQRRLRGSGILRGQTRRGAASHQQSGSTLRLAAQRVCLISIEALPASSSQSRSPRYTRMLEHRDACFPKGTLFRASHLEILKHTNRIPKRQVRTVTALCEL